MSVCVCGGAKRENGNVTCRRRINDSINTLTITRMFCCIALSQMAASLALSRSKQAPRMHRIVLWVRKGREVTVIHSHRNNNNTWHGTVFVVV